MTKMSDQDIDRIYKIFCRELANLRKEKTLTQEKVGKRIGISGGYLSKIENGLVSNAPLPLLIKICNIYNKKFKNIYEIAEQKMLLEKKQKE